MKHRSAFYKYLVTAVALTLGSANVAFAQNACDLDGNGSVNVTDVNRAVSMALGTTPCTASIEGPNTCTILTVRRVVNSALGQACAVYSAVTRTVVVTWLPSPSSNIAGYNVYRRTSPTGAPTKVNATLITGTTTFTDRAIQLGQTYYYSATAVDAAGLESSQSSQAVAVIPAS